MLFNKNVFFVMLLLCHQVKRLKMSHEQTPLLTQGQVTEQEYLCVRDRECI